MAEEIRVSLRAGGGALVVEVADSAGRAGMAETIDGPAVRSAIAELARELEGIPAIARRARWDRRPREGGARWTAFSALDSALTAVTSVATGLSIPELLGGQVRARAAQAPAAPDVGVLDVGALSCDETAARLLEQRPAAVLLDPRHWGVTAAARLDSLCRALQVSIGFRCENVGPLGIGLAGSLGSALPMATLGIIGAASRPVSIDEWVATREPVAGFGVS